MIKFFRKIRYNLMETGKTSKYLKYAIGEIILVVIGILIALQINNWNQERLTTREEYKALKNLKEDFNKNHEILTEVMKESTIGISSCLEMLKFTGSKQKPRNEHIFDSILNKIFISPAFKPINGTLDELINSGKLNIISNENLRKQLSTWHPHIEFVKERYDETNQNEKYTNEFMIANGSWLNADQLTTVNRTVKFPKSGFSVNNSDLLNKLEFENLIENMAIGFDNYLITLAETSTLLNDVLALINLEIEKFDD